MTDAGRSVISATVMPGGVDDASYRYVGIDIVPGIDSHEQDVNR